MTTGTSTATDESQIRGIIEKQVEAIRAKDINGVMSNVAPDVLSFDLLIPLQHSGADAIRKRAEEWFASFQGPLGYEVRELSITTSETVAFCHSLNGVNGTKTTGEKINMWWRATMCFRKIEGQWIITHEHVSVPFDMESGKASLDLKP